MTAPTADFGAINVMNFGIRLDDPCPCGRGVKYKFCCGKRTEKEESSDQVTDKSAFQAALQHHQAGRLREAEQFYRQMVARQPGHVDAMHYLGVIAYQMGRLDAALELIGRAICP